MARITLKQQCAAQQTIIDQLTEQLSTMSRRVKQLEYTAHVAQRVRRASMDAAREEAQRCGRTILVTKH